MARLRYSLLLAATLSLAFAPVALGLDFDDVGTFVSIPGDDDVVLHTIDATGLTAAPLTHVLCLGYLEDPDDPTDASDYAWFFHIDEDDSVACDTGEAVAEGLTYGITGFAGAAGVGWVTSSDDDYFGEVFDGTDGELAELDGGDFLCAMELDGSPGFSKGDAVVLNLEDFPTDAGADTLTIDDVVLTTVSTSFGSGVAASIGVVTGATDLYEEATDATDDPTTRPTGAGLVCDGFTVRAVNLEDPTDIDEEDLFYLLPPPPFAQGTVAGDEVVTQNMVRLVTNEAQGLNGGLTVRDGDDDLKGILRDLDTDAATFDCNAADDCTFAIAFADAGDDPEDDGVWLHFEDGDGTDDEVLPGDIVIRKLDAQDDATTDADGDLGETVTTAALGAGQAIDAVQYAPLDMFYYIDDDGDDLLDEDEPIYLKHPKNAGDGSTGADNAGLRQGDCTTAAAGERCLEEGDIRIRVEDEDPGSIVKDLTGNDFDEFSTTVGNSGLRVKAYNPEGDLRVPLLDVANDFFCDEDLDGVWDPATEDVYVSESSSTADNGVLLWDETGGGSEVAATDTTITLDAHCTAEDATSDVVAASLKTNGPVTTYPGVAYANLEASQSLYWSADSLLTVGDYRLNSPGALADDAVAAADAAFQQGYAQTSAVTFLLSPDVAATFPFQQVGDVQLFQGSSANNVGETLDQDSDVVPKLQDVPLAPIALRMDPDDTASLLDDAYYLYFGDADCTLAGDPDPELLLRLTHPSEDGGQLLTASDDEEAEVSIEDCQAAAEDEIGYVETSSNAALDPTDYLYFDSQTLGGDGAQDDMSRSDVRLTPVDEDENYDPGTIVQLSDDDYDLFNGDPLNGAFVVSWWDADTDGDISDGDMLWLQAAQTTYPRLNDVRLLGGGGSSGGGGGGGGSQDDDEAPDVSLGASPTSGDVPLEVTFTIDIDDPDNDDFEWSLDADGDGTADAEGDQDDMDDVTFTYEEAGTYTATLTAEDENGDEGDDEVDIVVGDGDEPTDDPTDDPTDGPGDGFTEADVAAANLAIAASLTVTRSGGSNVLTWDVQAGASGYQVWRADSPFQYVALVPDGTTGTYTDAKGSAGSSYLVTAFFHDAEGNLIGFLDDVNGGAPGIDDPTAEAQSATGGDGKGGGGKDGIPGLTLPLAALALVAAVVLVRRRL